MRVLVIGTAMCFFCLSSEALAHKQRGHGLVTVPTAAGISVTVNPSFAPKIVSFIADLVASGYKPRQIHCAASHGHVRGSRHYSGAACDFDQRGYGKTAPAMYHVAALAQRHGLRDGGSFRDWGHIDDGERLTRVARVPRTRLAGGFRQVPQMQPAPVW